MEGIADGTISIDHCFYRKRAYHSARTKLCYQVTESNSHNAEEGCGKLHVLESSLWFGKVSGLQNALFD